MPTIIGLQVKSGGCKLLDNGVANVYGVGAMSYDTGSDSMQVDCIVKAFDIPPTSADVTSASAVARASDASTGPLTGYCCSWQRGDGTNSGNNLIVFLSVVNGAFSILPGGSFTGMPTPNVGDTFSFKVAGSTLTASINGKQWASITDSTITAGHFGGCHFFRTATTDNAEWDNVNVFAVAAPPPVTGNRDIRIQPGQGGDNVTNGIRCAPQNMPRGGSCTLDARNLRSGGACPISADDGYGVEVGGANYPLIVINTGEGHYSVIQSNGTAADEYYGGQATGSPPAVTSFVNHMVTQLKGLGVGVGFDVATQMSQLFGCIRQADLASGVIPHGLQIALGQGSVLSKIATWPAISVDANASGNGGFVPYGALVCIASGATMPTFTGTATQIADLTAIWIALKNYGAYVVDGRGAGSTGVGFRAEAAAAGRLDSISFSSGLVAICDQLQWVTNNTADNGVTNLGGPGTRLAAYASVV